MAKLAPWIKSENIARIRTFLKKTYPALFRHQPDGSLRPLMLGIDQLLWQLHQEQFIALTEMEAEESKKIFRLCLSQHVQHLDYLNTLIAEGSQRYNLEGQPVSEVRDIDRQTAESRRNFQIQSNHEALKALKQRKKDPKQKLELEQNPEAAVPNIPAEPEPLPTPQPEPTALSSPQAAPTVRVKPPTAPPPLPSKPMKTPAVPPPKPLSTPAVEGEAVQAAARTAKITLVLDPASFTPLDSIGKKVMSFEATVAGQFRLTGTINSKSYRKILSQIEELGVENCNLILQGNMSQLGQLEALGIVVQERTAKVTAEV